MQEVEPGVFRGRAVAPIQLCDAVRRGAQQIIVAWCRLSGGVRPVRQQGKAEVAVLARQVVNLEALDLLVDRGARRQERRNDDDGAQVRRYAVAKLERGERVGVEIIGDGAVDDRDGQVRRRREGEQREQAEGPSVDTER